jgi:hypothetical protein
MLNNDNIQFKSFRLSSVCLIANEPMANFLVLSALVIMGISLPGEATVYTVGNSAGWDISADFPSWVSNKTFYVGDVLGIYNFFIKISIMLNSFFFLLF